MSISKALQTFILTLVSPFIIYAASAGEQVRLSRWTYAHHNQAHAQESRTTPDGSVNSEKSVLLSPTLSETESADAKAEGKLKATQPEVTQPSENSSISRKVNLRIPAPPLFNNSSRRLTLIATTYLDAYTILQENNSCSQFFGGPRIATNILNFLYPRLKNTSLGDSHVAIAMFGAITIGTDFQTGISYRLFQQALVNLRGPFYQSVNYRSQDFFHKIGHYPANTREARVSMLLHELGHLLPGSDGRWLLPDDGGNRIQIAANTSTIMSKCSEQINSLKVSGNRKSD